MSKSKKVSIYAMNVLATNKSLKGEERTLSGSRSRLLSLAKEINLPPHYKAFLMKSKKDKNLYGQLVEIVRKSKAGNYSPFFVLQGLHKLDKKEGGIKAILDGQKIANDK